MALLKISQSHFGKIFEIDVVSGQSHMLSMGHRNPQGLTLSSERRPMVDRARASRWR